MTDNMKIRQDGNKVTIEIDLSVDGTPPRPAGTKNPADKGTKNWGLATTNGNVQLAEEVNGRQVFLGLNLYTPQAPTAPAKKASASK